MNTTQFIAMVLWFTFIHIDLLRLFRELANLRSDIKKAIEPSDTIIDAFMNVDKTFWVCPKCCATIEDAPSWMTKCYCYRCGTHLNLRR